MFRVLIVDDEPDVIAGLRLLIPWQSFLVTQIKSALSYDEAVQTALTFKPHITISDVRIDKEWGFDLAKQFSDLGLHCSFVMISGYDDFGYVRKSMVVGARDYLLKPIAAEELERVLYQIITEEYDTPLKLQANNEHDDESIDPVTKKSYSSYTNLTNKVIQVIHRDFGQPLSLRLFSKQFMVSERHLGRVFSQDTGLKFSEYLFVFRLEKAKSILLSTDYKISDIAALVGYPHPNYFHQHFRSYFNLSPTELRSSYQLKEEAP